MRRDDTKRRIMDAALELFAAHGNDAVSVEQIAGAVGIKAPSLYNHFVSKRAIFDEIVSDAAARYEDFTAMQSVHVDDADADTGEFLGISEDVLCQLSYTSIAKAVRSHLRKKNGDAEGVRTLDLQRDRLAF